MLAPLIVLPAVTVPDVKQREFVSDTVPVNELPVWLRFADIDPLFPKVDDQPPCQAPDKTMSWMTLKVTVFDFPPPGGGFVTTTRIPPAKLRSDLLSVTMSRPLKNETVWGTPLKVTDDEAINPLPWILSVSGLIPLRLNSVTD
jgi:hypothetical protein